MSKESLKMHESMSLLDPSFVFDKAPQLTASQMRTLTVAASAHQYPTASYGTVLSCGAET